MMIIPERIEVWFHPMFDEIVLLCSAWLLAEHARGTYFPVDAKFFKSVGLVKIGEL